VPSAGAAPRTHELDVPAGSGARSRRSDPTRRGDRLPDRVTVRSSAAGRRGAAGAHEVPWRVRVQPPFTSRKHLPERLSRLRQLDGAVAVRQRGQGTEFDTLRDYVEGDDVRSIDWRATARRQDVVVRTWRPSATAPCCWWSTPAARPPAASATCRAWTPPSTPRCCSPRWRRARVTASTCWRSTASRAPRSRAPAARRPAPHRRRHGGPRAALVEADGRRLVGEVLRRARRRSLVVLFTSLDTAALEEGLLPHLTSLTSRHTVVLAAVADPRVEAMAAGRGTPRGGVRRRCGRASARRAPAADGPAAPPRRRGRRRRPEHFAPAVSDAYLSLKAAGRL
jgi:uncharacterized protein (DUF58 family)